MIKSTDNHSNISSSLNKMLFEQIVIKTEPCDYIDVMVGISDKINSMEDQHLSEILQNESVIKNEEHDESNWNFMDNHNYEPINIEIIKPKQDETLLNDHDAPNEEYCNTMQHNLSYHCSECTLKKDSKRFIIKHLLTEHKKHKLKFMQCIDCKDFFHGKVAFTKHAVEFHKKTFRCHKCYNFFFNAADLNEHQIEDHQVIKKMMSCSDCEYQSKNKHNLKQHIATIHFNKRWTCLECQKQFNTKGALTFHDKSVHKNIKPFKCSLCGHQTSKKQMLTQHVNAVHNKIRPFQCSFCDHRCSKKADLLRHEDTVHRNLKPFSCEECEYKCSIRTALKYHVESVHRKLKPFECAKCDYSCSRKADLKTHDMAIHTKIKPHQCSQCDYQSLKRHHLQHHMFKEHQMLLDDFVDSL